MMRLSQVLRPVSRTTHVTTVPRWQGKRRNSVLRKRWHSLCIVEWPRVVLNIIIISFTCHQNVTSASRNSESVSYAFSHHLSLHKELVNGRREIRVTEWKKKTTYEWIQPYR